MDNSNFKRKPDEYAFVTEDGVVGNMSDYQRRCMSKIARMKSLLEYNLISVQFVKSGENDPEVPVVVAHNPFNLSQHQIVCLLPSEELEFDLLADGEAPFGALPDESELGDNAGNYQMAIYAKVIESMVRAIEKDRTFREKVLPPGKEPLDYDDARKVYIDHYKINEGGDFNIPVE